MAPKPSSTKVLKPAPKWTPHSFKYGMPLYGIAWPEGKYVYMCGGGGGASSGIKNRLVIAKSKKGCLTDQVGEYNFVQDCPTRMVVCPGGKSLVIAMGCGGIKHMEIDTSDKKHPRVFESEMSSQAGMSAIKGDVKALAFDVTGSHLALGCADGTIYVLDWPSLSQKMVLSGDTKLAHGVRDLDLSRVAPVLAIVLEDGSCELHDWSQSKLLARLAPGRDKLRGERIILETGPTSTVVHHLPKGAEGVAFARLVFSRDPSHGGDLYAIMNFRQSGAWLACWQGAGVLPQDISLSRLSHVSSEPGTAVSMSRDALLLAVGTAEGTLLATRAADLTVLRKIPKAHMVFCTCNTFCDSPGTAGHVALSGSGDASAYVVQVAAGRSSIKRTLFRAAVLLLFLLVLLVLAVVAISEAAGAKELSLGPTWEPLLARLRAPLATLAPSFGL